MPYEGGYAFDRQKHILNVLELQNRAITIGVNFPAKNETTLNIDFLPVNKILNTEREKSMSFLKNAIEN